MSIRWVWFFGHWLLPRALRIAPGARPCRPRSPAALAALALRERTVPAAPPAAPRPVQLPEGMAVELCNFLHRAGLGIRELRAVAGAERPVRSLGMALEQMRQQLKAEGVEFTDLTGHAWTPERADFECQGKVRTRLGIAAATIASCVRPSVTIGGELVQQALGEAVRPPSLGSAPETEEKA